MTSPGQQSQELLPREEQNPSLSFSKMSHNTRRLLDAASSPLPLSLLPANYITALSKLNRLEGVYSIVSIEQRLEDTAISTQQTELGEALWLGDYGQDKPGLANMKTVTVIRTNPWRWVLITDLTWVEFSLKHSTFKRFRPLWVWSSLAEGCFDFGPCTWMEPDTGALVWERRRILEEKVNILQYRLAAAEEEGRLTLEIRGGCKGDVYIMHFQKNRD